MTINLTQIRSDFDNGIIVSKQTLLALVDYAIELESMKQNRLQYEHSQGFDKGYKTGIIEACSVCEARVMGDNNREDQEAKRCAEAIREHAAKEGYAL